MKTKNLVKVGTVVLSIVAASVVAALLLTQNQTSAKTVNSPSSLKDVSALELPAVAAQIIANAPQDKRAEVAAETIRMAAKFAHPGTLAYVTGAICKSAPDVAPIVLQEAIEAKPEEILPIAKASFAAAPSRIQELVKVACESRPELFATIARLADAEVPNKTDAILNGVKAGLPQLNIHIDKAVSTVTPNTIAGIMEYVEKTAISEARTQAIDNQRQQVVRTLENQNSTVSSVEPMTIVQKTASLDQKAKKSIAAAERNVANSSAGVKYSLSGPTITPVPYTPPLYNIKPQDTTIIQPGAGRNYSAP